MRKQGFTLIELMVVVLIVAVLAAILVPMMTARLESARWAEGKAGAGSLATSMRAIYAEVGEEGWDELGDTTDPLTYLNDSDLRGKYFSYGDYDIEVSLGGEGSEYPLIYTITVNPPSDPTETVTWKKAGFTLDHTGKWTELSPGP